MEAVPRPVEGGGQADEERNTNVYFFWATGGFSTENAVSSTLRFLKQRLRTDNMLLCSSEVSRKTCGVVCNSHTNNVSYE